jgi:hypothetical protein
MRRQWQVTRGPALKAQVNRLQRSVTYRLNEQWSDTLEFLDSEDQSLWKMTNRVMRVPTPSPPLQAPGGLALSDSEKAEALADSLDAQFQAVNDPSIMVMVNEAMRAYVYGPTREPKLTSPSEVLQVIRRLKVGKAPGPNGIPNRVMRHLPMRATIFFHESD